MTEYELCLREAEKTDADLIAFLNQVGSESDYMTLDEAGILMNQEEMASFMSIRLLPVIRFICWRF